MNKSITIRVVVAIIIITVFAIIWNKLDRISIRVIGQQQGSGGVYLAEEEFFKSLPATTNIPLDITYSPVDRVGLKDSHQLLMLKQGALDLVSLRFAQNAHIEPTLLGVDLIGSAVDVEIAYAIMRSYYSAIDRRLQHNFNAKLLGMWPFGPQVFFCKKPVYSLHDLDGLNIRVGNEMFSPLIERFGGSAFAIPFEYVAENFRNNFLDCALSSAASANAAGWPAYTTHFYSLQTQMGINGYAINLDLWNRLSKSQQMALGSAFNDHVASIWSAAFETHEVFSACNTGGSCDVGTPYNLIHAVPTEDDKRLFQQAFQELILPQWGASCDQLYSDCSSEWHDLVGSILTAQP